MELPDTFLVTPENGPRPFGSPDKCFYCGQPVGTEHKDGCVCREKLIMLRITMTIPVVVPASWDNETIDFKYNDSSWCGDNIIDDLQRYYSARTDEAPCLCGSATFEYVRDADADDLMGIDLNELREGK